VANAKRTLNVRNLKFTIEYDGTDFVGWQRQDAGVSIQGLIEDALAPIEGRPVTVHGAGRTDAGVHALGQVASARLETTLDPITLQRALNATLPEAVRIAAVEEAADDFHARFSARLKTYEYRLWNDAFVPPFVRRYVWHIPQPLDLAALAGGAAALEGEHDFAAFQGSGGAPAPTVRRVRAARWRADPPSLVLEIAGEGFLRHMVRAIVGTLVDVGLGRSTAADVPVILASRDRSRAGVTAPASGLFLVRVDY
jgi:tRNA pseudouridine38-40 synthase